LKPILTDKYDNLILQITRLAGGEWTESKTAIWDEICRITGMEVNKKAVFDRINHLESVGHIESKTEKNRKQYRRKDSGDSHLQFIQIMKDFEVNQKAELEKIKKLKTITKANGKLGIKGKELLDHVQGEVDRAYMMIVRVGYQSQLNVIPNDIGNERIETLEDYIDVIMNALQKKYDKEVMKEYFQNHVKKLEFKI
jgi:DNA-binding PadR family transcriptional regulator